MHWLIGGNWRGAWVPNVPLLEIFVRGSVIYLALFLLLRFVLKRQRGGVGVTDLLVIVLIADAAQNGMAGQYNSLPDAILLVAVIIGWAWLLDWIGYHVPALERLLRPKPLLLVKHGRVIDRNAAKESVTDEELLTELRLQGLTRIEDAEEVYLEGDGQITVIPKDGRPAGNKSNSDLG